MTLLVISDTIRLMNRAEGTAQSYPALLSAMQFHYKYSVSGLKRIVTPQDDFLAKIQRELLNVPVRNVYHFLQECGAKTIQPIEIRPESFNFSLVNGDNSVFAKIYNGAGIDKNIAQAFATRAFPNVPHILIAKSSHTQDKAPHEIAIEELTRDNRKKLDANPYLYASAEIYTRTIAHITHPEVMHRPIALVDEKDEAVGFYLKLGKNQYIASAQHVAKQDVAFFVDPNKPTQLIGIVNFKESNELSPAVAEVIAALRKINVLVYQEKPDDLLNQVLLNEQGEFVTFARVGYLLSD